MLFRSDESNEVSTTVDRNPSLSVTKTVADGSETADHAGQVLSYSIAVTNDGNVTLDAPSISDANAVVSASYTGDTDEDGQLDVNETWTYTATHTVTQAEMDAGADIVNVASATSGDATDESNEVSTTVDRNPSLSVTKTVADGSETADHAEIGRAHV